MRIAGPFYLCGPRLREEGVYGRAVSRFIAQALASQPITVYGDGTRTRSFCYVTDAAIGLLLLMANEGARGGVVNVGNSEEVTIFGAGSRD